jgi:hypothetical protein
LPNLSWGSIFFVPAILPGYMAETPRMADN